jgi:hypothetical protein
MESRLRRMQPAREGSLPDGPISDPPEPPPKHSPWISRPGSSVASRQILMRKHQSCINIFGQTALKDPIHDLNKARSTTSLGIARYASDEVTNQTFSEISSHSSGSTPIGASADTPGAPIRVTDDVAEDSSDDVTGNALGKRSTNVSHQVLDDALEGTSDTAMNKAPSPSSVIRQGDGQPIRPIQPSKLLEGSKYEVADMGSIHMPEGISDSDVADHTIPEPHESPTTTLVSYGMFHSVMSGFTRTNSILRSPMRLIGRRRSVRITWNCVSSHLHSLSALC